MDRILALQRLTYTPSLPEFQSIRFEETLLISSVSGICTACSNGLAQAAQN